MLLLRPLLCRMTGDESYQMEKRVGVLQVPFPKESRKRRFVRAIWKDGAVTLPDGLCASGAIGALRGCNCLLDIPAGSPPLLPGEEVSVWLL